MNTFNPIMTNSNANYPFKELPSLIGFLSFYVILVILNFLRSASL
jgi:hypothetical protein